MTATTQDRQLTFTRWLTRQSTRNDAVGDLARDAALDPDWPAKASERGIREYIKSRAGDPSAALSALKRAIKEWRKEEHDE